MQLLQRDFGDDLRFGMPRPGDPPAMDAFQRVRGIGPGLEKAPDGVLGEFDQSSIHAQPAIFTFGYALASWLLSLGLKPDVVGGHSIGEYAAAVIAGIIPLEEGVKLVAHLGRYMQELQEALLWVRHHTEPNAVLVANSCTPENMKKDHWGALDRKLGATPAQILQDVTEVETET